MDVNKNYRVITDPYQFIIQRRAKPSLGWVDVSYHPTMNLVVKRLLDFVSLEEIEDLVRLNSKMNAIKRWADKSLK